VWREKLGILVFRIPEISCLNECVEFFVFFKQFQLNNAGVDYANVRFQPTYAYDIDPAVGSTAMPGFSELSGIYTHYRVNKFRAHASVCAFETFPTVAYMDVINVDPGTNSTHYPAFLTSRRCVKQAISAQGGMDRCDLNIEGSLGDFGGYKELIEVGDSTVGSTGGTAPVNNMFITVGGITTAAVHAFANGQAWTFTMDVELDFFELYTPDT